MVTKEQLLNLTKNDSLSVYSGRIGCMCGCIGTYKYSSKTDFSKYSASYALGEEDISDKLVSTVLNKLKKNIEDVSFGPNYAYFENKETNHCWAIYPTANKD